MSTQLTNYSWFESYVNAICEADDTKKAGLLLEARSAVEQRLLSPVRPGSDEDKAIKAAQVGLRVLTAERVTVTGRLDDHLQGVPS